MNYCVVNGTIQGEIISELNDGMRCCKFNIKNSYYLPHKSAKENTLIRCVAYGALAEYVYNEMYEGASILITGRILNRHYVVNNVSINRLYIGCNTVSMLEQEEYS